MAGLLLYILFFWLDFRINLCIIETKTFCKPGFLRLPMLPLYGSGAVMMLWVSLPVKNNLFLVYISGVIAATALEYVTGYVMEQLFKVRYWDYSSQKFQVHGYICLSSSIAWGFLTILMTEIIHEPVAGVVLNFNQNILLFCVFIVSILFTADAYESVKEALALGKSLEAMTKLKEEMEDLQSRISALKEEAAEHVSAVKEGTAERIVNSLLGTAELLANAKEETAERLAAAKEGTAERLAAAKEGTSERLAAAKEGTSERIAAVRESTREKLAMLTGQLDEIMDKRHKLLSENKFRHFYRRSLLRGNPGAVSTRFSAALKELKEQLEELNH